MDDRVKAEALARTRNEIARRIKRVCMGLSTSEFEGLVDRIAQVQYKYEVLPAFDPIALLMAEANDFAYSESQRA